MKTNFEFKPFDKVLVRDGDEEEWRCSHYSHESGKVHYCISGCWVQYIPFEGNEHLLGTADPYIEPYEPKDGDFVVSGWKMGDNECKWIAIVKGCDFSKTHYETYEGFFIEGKSKGKFFFFYSCTAQKYTRAATEEEKQLLLSKMHENGKDWDEEKKEIIDWKWEPKRDDTYFYPKFDRIRGEFIVDDVLWESMDEWFDKAHYERGWVFGSKEKCQVICDKLNEAIKKVE